MTEKESVPLTADEFRILNAAIKNAINTIARYAEPIEAEISKKKGIAGLVGKDLETAGEIITKLEKKWTE